MSVEITSIKDRNKGRVTRDESTVSVRLLEPLVFTANKMDGERTLDTLTFPRGIKARHLLAMDKADGDMGKTLALIAALARIPPAAAHELDGRDLELIMTVIEPFLPGLQGTGRC